MHHFVQRNIFLKNVNSFSWERRRAVSFFSVERTWDLISESDEGSAEPTALQSCCHFLAFLTLQTRADFAKCPVQMQFTASPPGIK